MNEQGNQLLVMQFLQATQSGDVDTMTRLAAEDFVMFWPQSGERFSGRHKAIGAMVAQRDRPEMAGESRLIGSGDLWVNLVPLRYGEDIYHYVGVIELEDGLIKRGTGYFAAPFPAQDYRAEFADKNP